MTRTLVASSASSRHAGPSAAFSRHDALRCMGGCCESSHSCGRHTECACYFVLTETDTMPSADPTSPLSRQASWTLPADCQPKPGETPAVPGPVEAFGPPKRSRRRSFRAVAWGIQGAVLVAVLVLGVALWSWQEHEGAGQAARDPRRQRRPHLRRRRPLPPHRLGSASRRKARPHPLRLRPSRRRLTPTGRRARRRGTTTSITGGRKGSSIPTAFPARPRSATRCSNSPARTRTRPADRPSAARPVQRRPGTDRARPSSSPPTVTWSHAITSSAARPTSR